MKIFKNIKFIDLFITTFISIFICVPLYSFLFKICTYSNLHDFYVGTSIYFDHNKYLDIGIYFVYLLFFFILLPMISYSRRKFCKPVKQTENENKQNINNYSNVLTKIKDLLLKYQFIGVFGFVFLYPFNYGFYPVIFAIVICLILLSLYDVWKINKYENNKRFSVFILTAVVFVFRFYSYIVTYGPTDDHHFGEKFATFFMHNSYNLEYYKEIMLVHGYLDVIPSWIGCYFFNENNVLGYSLGEIFFRNLLIILTLFSAFLIFDKNKLFVVPLLFFKGTNITVLFLTTYLLLLKESFLKQRYIWLSVYCTISFIFCMIWTTIGSFWLVASTPLLIHQIIKIYNLSDNNKMIKLFFSFLPFSLLLYFSHSTIYEYFKEMSAYVSGNLLVFGNLFGELNLTFFSLLKYGFKLFALFFLPVLVCELLTRIKKNENTTLVYFLLFAIILPIISISYTLGRTDLGCFYRIEFISQAYLLVFLPYFLYKFSSKKYNHFLLFIMICILLFSLFNFSSKFKSPQINKREYYLNNVGKIALKEDYAKRVENVNRFVEMNSDSDSVFLDLTNRGMHYLYLNKKIPIKFVSFYNVISTKQSVAITEKLKRNPPDVILIDSDSIFHDNVHLSLRLNSLYKWLLLSKKYKLKIDNDNIFLIKNEEYTNYTNKEMYILDNVLGFRNLNYLPEVWGNSIKKLPLNEVKADIYIYNDKSQIKIRFVNPISGSLYDFLYIEPVIPLKEKHNFYVQINNSDSEIFCRTKRGGRMLIPLDNYPSWLLNEKIEEINIYSNKALKGKYTIKFYKRKM